LGLRRSGGQLSLVNDEGEWGTIGSLSTQLINDCPDLLKESVMCQFIHFNQKALKQFDLPWFLPEYVCGVGMPTVGRYAPARFDLQVARKVLENPDKFFVPSVKPDVPYKVWEYAQSRFKKVSCMRNIGPVGGETVSTSDILGAFCIESLFCARFDDVFKSVSPDGQKVGIGQQEMSAAFSTMRKIARTWKKARTDQTITLGSPYVTVPTKFSTDSGVPFAFESTRSRLMTE